MSSIPLVEMFPQCTNECLHLPLKVFPTGEFFGYTFEGDAFPALTMCGEEDVSEGPRSDGGCGEVDVVKGGEGVSFLGLGGEDAEGSGALDVEAVEGSRIALVVVGGGGSGVVGGGWGGGCWGLALAGGEGFGWGKAVDDAEQEDRENITGGIGAASREDVAVMLLAQRQGTFTFRTK
ncbi:LOW QUALITY PROTEIN: hypothetical protein HJC23_011541 [Cyclotella cryptica]|uniref:Uncharacterized protein n=1 Tax=Cyclotella cryptica TaxID=29204 RepID=A0ABD3PTZ3_9STRA